MAGSALSCSAPHLFPFAGEERSRACPDAGQPREKMWGRLSLHRLGSWLKKEDEGGPPHAGWDRQQHSNGFQARSGSVHRRPSRKVVPGLPRPITFKRQNSERRDRLTPHEPDPAERRAVSADRRAGLAGRRALSPPPVSIPSRSAPEVRSSQNDIPITVTAPPDDREEMFLPEPEAGGSDRGGDDDDHPDFPLHIPDLPPPPPSTSDGITDGDDSEGVDEYLIQHELDTKWILNLSMHFRDKSDREKFFVTFAEEPNRWRRVTISCDYRDVPPDSLEADLKSLHYQRDKSKRIYDSIRDSLPDIQFYPTVTNLKLQTDEGRLHVHVTEDVNEIIPYPSVSAIEHLDCRRVRESDVHFESHISGFVYKVAVLGEVFIKKEIPGPDTVEEFLYEVNTLCSLRTSRNVIRFEGIIVDDRETVVRGLLISYADNGALVDLIYDWKSSDSLPWPRRERWAKQIIRGLSEIHESGFVQGDFTLSNIVVDGNDDAKIIDINRRGCPVGWEPPELSRLIESGQRIGIYIGVKSDLFQLGMVLWALAQNEDEPERQERPLQLTAEDVPQYFKDMVAACLSDDPRDRPSAKDLVARFPDIDQERSRPVGNSRNSVSTHRSDKEYIDPATAVGLEDIDQHKRRTNVSGLSAELASADPTPSTNYRYDSSSSYVVARRARSPAAVEQPYHRPVSTISLPDSELVEHPPQREPPWEQIYIDGDTRFVQRGSVRDIGHVYADQEDPTACIPASAPASMPAFPNDLGMRLRRSTGPGLPIRNPSFHERVHLRRSEDSTLADLEKEVTTSDEPFAMDPEPRFGPPVHHDSGFDEPQRNESNISDFEPIQSEEWQTAVEELRADTSGLTLQAKRFSFTDTGSPEANDVSSKRSSVTTQVHPIGPTPRNSPPKSLHSIASTTRLALEQSTAPLSSLFPALLPGASDSSARVPSNDPGARLIAQHLDPCPSSASLLSVPTPLSSPRSHAGVPIPSITPPPTSSDGQCLPADLAYKSRPSVPPGHAHFPYLAANPSPTPSTPLSSSQWTMPSLSPSAPSAPPKEIVRVDTPDFVREHGYLADHISVSKDQRQDPSSPRPPLWSPGSLLPPAPIREASQQQNALSASPASLPSQLALSDWSFSPAISSTPAEGPSRDRNAFSGAPSSLPSHMAMSKWSFSRALVQDPIHERPNEKKALSDSISDSRPLTFGEARSSSPPSGRSLESK